MGFWNRKTTWEIVLEDFDLSEGVQDAVKELVGTAIEESTKALAPNVSNEIIIQVGLAALKPFGGDVVVAVIKALLNKTDRIQSLIEKQIVAPFETGSRMIKEGITLEGSTLESSHFRNDHLRDGITELERAWTLAEGKKSQDAIRFQIRLLQGLAALKMEGGAEYARLRIQDCYVAIRKWIMDIDGLIHAEKKKKGKLQQDFDTATAQLNYAEANNVVWRLTPATTIQDQFRMQAAKHKADIKLTQSRIDELNRKKMPFLRLSSTLKAIGVPLAD